MHYAQFNFLMLFFRTFASCCFILFSISTTFQLSTNLVRNFYIEAAAALYWPSLVAESIYEFPLTHIGKKSASSSIKIVFKLLVTVILRGFLF